MLFRGILFLTPIPRQNLESIGKNINSNLNSAFIKSLKLVHMHLF